ncbi:hypothetical protein MY1884_009469 [Beauveria asiatica]
MATQGPLTASLSHLCDLPLYKKETPYEIWAENIDSTITKTNVKLEIVHNCALHDVRRSKSTHPRTKPNIYSLKGKEGNELRATQINSSHLIHSDGSPGFMKKVLASVTAGDDAKWNDTSKYRIRGLTVWCPIVDVVESDPLVLCDIRTVEDSDWDVVEKVLDHSVEENSAPHCSMVLRDGDIRSNARPRESIELRVLAWNELQ